jgi:hypothetical protein
LLLVVGVRRGVAVLVVMVAGDVVAIPAVAVVVAAVWMRAITWRRAPNEALHGRGS